MSEVARRKPINFPFRRPSAGPARQPQFQVILSLVASEPCSPEDIEEAVTQAVAALVEDATHVALGPVGGADFTSSTVELEFTIEAVSPAVLHAKMGEVLRVLERRGFEYAGSTDTRLDPRRDLEVAVR